jgi:hypothetical protein
MNILSDDGVSYSGPEYIVKFDNFCWPWAVVHYMSDKVYTRFFTKGAADRVCDDLNRMVGESSSSTLNED